MTKPLFKPGLWVWGSRIGQTKVGGSGVQLESTGGNMCEEFGSLLYSIPFWLLTSVQHASELPRTEYFIKVKRIT